MPLLFALVPLALAFMEWFRRIAYELSGPYTWDTPIYWAVGRGIANGIHPWTGLFETKPPGIFLLSALSIKLIGTPQLTHLFQVFALVLLTLAPLFLIPWRHSRWPMFFLSLWFGLLLSQYVAERSGEVQVESFGAAFSALAVIAFARSRSRRYGWFWSLLASLGLLGACGMKEPFFFSLLGAALLLLRRWRAWFFRWWLPFAFAIVAGLAFLLVNGWLHDYWTHYLTYMASVHVERSGSPLDRASEFWHTWEDLNNFAWMLGTLIIFLGIVPFLFLRKRILVLFRSSNYGFRLFAALWLASFALGMGGQFYNHHHVFAVPLYLALWALFARLVSSSFYKTVSAVSLVLVGFALACASISLPEIHLSERQKNLEMETQRLRAEALYIDSLLDRCGVRQYQFLGGNGNQVYGWTRHSPQGPFFFQLGDFWEYSGFLDSMQASVKRSDLVIFQSMDQKLGFLVWPLLKSEFTKEPWPQVRNLVHPSMPDQVFFRIGACQSPK
ncbi:MAG TPA: hypothetical protein VLM37_08730 [Fibrobacteraceae bacterium]|nr:hypothetical protein [Fibrobacteraceae bacterium]